MADKVVPRETGTEIETSNLHSSTQADREKRRTQRQRRLPEHRDTLLVDGKVSALVSSLQINVVWGLTSFDPSL